MKLTATFCRQRFFYAAFSGDAVRRSGRQRASGENRSAIPAAKLRARFYARDDSPGAGGGAAGSEFCSGGERDSGDGGNGDCVFRRDRGGARGIRVAARSYTGLGR